MAEVDPRGEVVGEVTVRRLSEPDWATYRTIRLEMLRESPGAYGMTHAESVEFPEEHWRRRLHDSATFLATVDGEPVGSATVFVPRAESGAEGDPELVAVWVDPRRRRGGVGRRLVAAAVDHAVADGRERLWLSVVDTNPGAAALYLTCGFIDSGEREPYPNDPGVLEVRMVADLAATRPAGA